ncbi:MAG: phospholipid scramblase family protein [Acidimicrobiia bacterium]|nr:phospholipid scramblase family protein [Acidimicrobiia bacterium]
MEEQPPTPPPSPPPTPPNPPTPTPPTAGAFRAPQGADDASKVQDQVQRQAGVSGAGTGGGTLFTEPVLVVNQKAKLIELVAEFKVFDQNGNQVGSVAQVGQSQLKKALRLVSSLDQFMTHTYEIRDAQDQPVLVLTRPRKFMKSKFSIKRADGSEVGAVVQKNMIGKIRFSLEAGGKEVGSLNAENWRAWNFNVQDASGREVARITKTWEGLAKTMFTTADNYVLQMHEPLTEPLLSLVVATALCVDTALKQDSRGLS